MSFAIDPARLEAQAAELTREGVRHVELQVPDLDGGLRGKLVSIDKAMSAKGAAFCTILFGLTSVDDVYESVHSSSDNGFPDNLIVADPDTVVVFDAGSRRLGAALCDTLTPDGSLFPLSPRSLVRTVAADAADLGYEIRFGFEYEICVVRRDVALAAGDWSNLTPPDTVRNAYSLLRTEELRDLGLELMDRLADVGIALDAIHTELGHGMLEMALPHAPPLQAADMAARAKLVVKQTAQSLGYTASFMAKYRMSESGCGGHVHQSLWKDGAPAFLDGGALSPAGAAYVAGLAATMPDFAAIFFPTVNAYRRLDAGAWAPENASWGLDNRTAALRVITTSAKAARVEHRAPGADANPYLAVAAMLAGGVHGLRCELSPGAPATGNASKDARFRPLPRTLAEAVDLFEASPVARAAFGDAFVDHFALSRREEWRLWTEYLQNAVTRWELDRYFVTI
ncbi:glutamine synthetase family protein [Acuticoccus mangrovi]|uniref:Glutamine synthetase n=1 Tax=Acuticoccus mangrovi TaxID=2796142 RepID=A0A934IV78_9HYPH|nr:glutamine synthetase family protein [Acuticoccus mangrovi]MBJ3778635.1 glutamine synthetase [Acuticoccus mangrovi]